MSTGSHQQRSREGVAQSLSGRIALLTLLPLSICELCKAGIMHTRDEYFFRGFLPAIYDKKRESGDVHIVYAVDERPIAGGGKFFNFRNVAALTDGMMQVAWRKDKER